MPVLFCCVSSRRGYPISFVLRNSLYDFKRVYKYQLKFMILTLYICMRERERESICNFSGIFLDSILLIFKPPATSHSSSVELSCMVTFCQPTSSFGIYLLACWHIFWSNLNLLHDLFPFFFWGVNIGCHWLEPPRFTLNSLQTCKSNLQDDIAINFICIFVLFEKEED
jgi:hypothetical protein